jgi:thiol-disulfide isomerase/thioredoxin
LIQRRLLELEDRAPDDLAGGRQQRSAKLLKSAFMRKLLLALAVFGTLTTSFMARAQSSPIVAQIERNVAQGDMAGAKQTLEQYRTALGVTSDYLEALSWVGRGELARRNFAAALENAREVRELALAQLKHRKLDADASLPTALGASIEVQAQAAAADGRRDEAVTFLRAELNHWRDTSIYPRIRKNLNLLTMTGKAAPPLDVSHWIGDRKPRTLAQYAGHPVLLFFWAHWCADCKVEVAAIRKIREEYGPRGLEVVAPTQHYGYIAGGQEATPEVETPYIRDVFAKYYSRIGAIDAPLSEQNFQVYGVSTTPTVVLIDRHGLVRLYNPGRISYEQLAAKVQPLLQPAPHAASHAGQHHHQTD